MEYLKDFPMSPRPIVVNLAQFNIDCSYRTDPKFIIPKVDITPSIHQDKIWENLKNNSNNQFFTLDNMEKCGIPKFRSH
jgi:hypothetical protein